MKVMNAMIKYTNLHFKDENDVRNFVKECELSFEEQLDKLCDAVVKNKDLRIITLAGPTCSGKTTTANKLIKALGDDGKEVKVISIDDFFLDRPGHTCKNMHVKMDFETVKAIDLPYLSECVSDMLAGRTVKLPVFNFKEGIRTGYAEYTPQPGTVYLFEGIQAIYPEVTALFPRESHTSIYISVAQDIEINGTVFEPREVRLARRIVRDYSFRGASPEFVLYLWPDVQANEDKNIIPYSGSADFRIDSTLGYEVCMLKEPLLKLLEQVTKDSQYYDQCREIAEKYRNVPAISKEFLPSSSVYREFLG